MKKLATLFLAILAVGTFSLKAQDAAEKDVVMGIAKEYAAALNLNEEQRGQSMEILKDFVTKVKSIDLNQDSDVSFDESVMSLMKESNMRMKALLNDEQTELFGTKKAELQARVMKHLQLKMEEPNQSDEE